jgi:hypothetical protein
VFYNTNENDNLDNMLRIITGDSKISLRIVDWFATNYAKKFYTLYTIEQTEDNVARRFKVYDDYKLKLKAYSKKLFDPFCRRERIMFQIEGHPMFQTTVGKLNFFRWAIEKGVLNYIKLNLPQIEKAMNVSARELNTVRKAISASTTSTPRSCGSAPSMRPPFTVPNWNAPSCRGQRTS